MNLVDAVDGASKQASLEALGLSRATYYRRGSESEQPAKATVRRPSPRALSTDEQESILRALHEPRFVDLAPAEVYATLLDEGVYIASERTMYRLLASQEEVRERRNQLTHGSYSRPELKATRPNEVWSWDITKLLSVKPWTYYYLYVIIDIYSRYVVGWTLANEESNAIAKSLIAESFSQERVLGNQLTLHADRGSSMKSKAVALLLSDLGVTKTHSRPHVSNDNPYSESHFKTLKYRPDYPDRFGSIAHARSFHADFFRWYNEEHHHSGLALLTPADVHRGRARERLASREKVLADAYSRHPERFPNGPPRPVSLPPEVWINGPSEEQQTKVVAEIKLVAETQLVAETELVAEVPPSATHSLRQDLHPRLPRSHPAHAQDASSEKPDARDELHGRQLVPSEIVDEAPSHGEDIARDQFLRN